MGYEWRGAARELWSYKGLEVILSGPYETGKTLACVFKLHALLSKYPNSHAVMVRQTYKSLISSVVRTYENKVLAVPPSDPRCPVKKYGGEKPEWYDYPNGSRLTLGGMDKPDKFLSAEYDFVYINQAEELKLDAYEKLVGRATGRAGNAPYSQVLADCNPSHPKHWILFRKPLKRLESRHEDNPALYTKDGQKTAQGEITMAAQDALTGLRLARGRYGRWVAAEGQIYEEFDPNVHVIDSFEVPSNWNRYRVIDFGFNDPFVCQWWAIDPDTGNLYLYRELYQTKRTVTQHSETIKRHSQREHFVTTICDHDREDRQTLMNNGIPNTHAEKSISLGIDLVKEYLAKEKLFIMRDALIKEDLSLKKKFKPLCTEEEFSAYVWHDKKVDTPKDTNNHGMDALRYMVAYLEEPVETERWVRLPVEKNLNDHWRSQGWGDWLGGSGYSTGNSFLDSLRRDGWTDRW